MPKPAGGEVERNRARVARWQRENPEKYRAKSVRYIERNRQKRRARAALNYAVESGRIRRPGRCERCTRRCTPHGHHDDHSRPLEVEWLCDDCHYDEHHPKARAA